MPDFCVFIFGVLEIEARASCMLDKALPLNYILLYILFLDTVALNYLDMP